MFCFLNYSEFFFLACYSYRVSVSIFPPLQSECLYLSSTTESECRGEPVRDFYQVQRGYTICQTTRMVSWVECAGACDTGACCASQRMKRRKYTFECSNGRSFSEEVEKTIKCGCVGCM